MPPEAEARRVAVLVTGMHRTGTSALARTLSLLGLALPADLVAANEGNPHGHWEPLKTVELNDRMLADAGSDLYGVSDIAPEWFGTAEARSFVDQAEAVLHQSYAGQDLIVLKDPRTALLLPVWHEALARRGYRVVHVLPLRHPADVAASLRRRHLKTIPYDAWSPPRGEAVWLRYTLAAVRGSRGYERAFIRYDDLLGDWRREARRLERELGLTWPALGGDADQDIDAFLHSKAQADGGHDPVGIDDSSLDEGDLLHVSAALHDLLVARGDDREAVDAIDRRFRERLGGARDLIAMFETLYPLVWSYFTASNAATAQVQEAQAVEEDLRASKRQMWSALTRANDETMVLRQDLTSRIEHIASLEAALDRHRRGPGDDPRGQGDAEPPPEPEPETRELDAMRADCERLAQQLLDARSGRERDIAAFQAQLEAVRQSTSWRITAPLRVVSQLVRRRP